jgi:hypothetical protein
MSGQGHERLHHCWLPVPAGTPPRQHASKAANMRMLALLHFLSISTPVVPRLEESVPTAAVILTKSIFIFLFAFSLHNIMLFQQLVS